MCLFSTCRCSAATEVWELCCFLSVLTVPVLILLSLFFLSARCRSVFVFVARQIRYFSCLSCVSVSLPKLSVSLFLSGSSSKQKRNSKNMTTGIHILLLLKFKNELFTCRFSLPAARRDLGMTSAVRHSNVTEDGVTVTSKGPPWS